RLLRGGLVRLYGPGFRIRGAVESSAFASAKLLIQVSPPLLALGLRFFIAGVVMVGYGMVVGSYRPVGWKGWGQLTVLGLLNQAGYQGLAWVAMGLGLVSSAITAVIISMNPIVIALLAVPFLGERMSARRIAGLLLGMVGVVIVLNSRVNVTGEDPFGLMLIGVALLSMSAGSILYKRWNLDMPLSVSVGGQFLTAGVAIFIVGLFTEDPSEIIWGAQYAIVMVYIVLGATVGGIGLWFYLLSHGSASDASALHFLMPPFGLMYGWVLLGEPVAMGDLIGIIPIGLGIWLATHRRRSLSDEKEA
ncbi:DMT family transporter, partial [Pseudomonadota bacterium]